MLSVLGIGGMGEVYKAEHVHLHALRVIKLMRPNIAGDQGANERFLREARMATRIQHQNVTALYDFSALPDGSFYMVWEHVEGENLRSFVLQRQFLRPELAIRLASQALMGLDAIHRAGIVHRDVSPENLMVTRDEHGLDRVKIIDLGVAKQWDDTGDEQTKTGIFVGKFKYCSPEQLGMLEPGERIDGRSDIYSFALVLYEMLTGVAPFQAETPHQYLLMQTQQMPPPLRQANPSASVPPQLETLIFRALAKNRERRFASAYDFARALEAALPALPQTVELPSTVVSAIPLAQSVVDVPLAPAPKPQASTTVRTASSDSTPGRKRDLYDEVALALGNEQFAKADAALQTLKMHLGVKAETDGQFRRLRKELEAGAAEKESWFVAAIESAKQQGQPKEVQRLVGERDERLGRRLAPPALKFETEVWLRRRDELLAKIRTWIAGESFASAGRTLDELGEHLEGGAATDEEYLALRNSFQQALIDSSEKVRQEIVAAHAAENIAKTRRLLAMYDAKFGQERRKHGSIQAAEAWIREMDAMRGSGSEKAETTAVRRVKQRRSGVLIALVLLLLLAGGAVAVWYLRPELIRPFLHAEPAAPVVVQPHAGETWTNPVDHLVYVWIPKGFWISTTEVTNEAFAHFHPEPLAHPDAKIDGPLPALDEPAQPKWPATGLSYADATAYCKWAGGRLPTEQEWELVAQATVPARNVADDTMIKRFHVARRAQKELFPGTNDGFATLAPVGSFAPNRLGVFDLEGNVWEWCAGEVLRGGSWASAARDVSPTARKQIGKDESGPTIGCRCVIESRGGGR